MRIAISVAPLKPILTKFSSDIAITVNLTMAMAVLLIFLDPWHTSLAVMVGLPTYSVTILLTLLLILFQYMKGRGEFSTLSEKHFYLPTTAAICLMVLMLFRFSPVVGAYRIFSSVIVPFGLGILLGLFKDRNSLSRYLGASQLLKLILLVPLAGAYFQAYPKRPMLYGEELYLLFGAGLDASIGGLIIMIAKERGWLRGVACLFLPVVAFNLVGMNSRGLLASSLLIGLVAASYGHVRRRVAVLAFLGYVASVTAVLLLLPGRIVHWEAMVGTLLSQLGMVSYQGYVDTSTTIRVDSIRQLLQYSSLSAFGHSLEIGDAHLLAHHFFPIILLYGTGFVGLALFCILWSGVVLKALSLIRCSDSIFNVIGFFGLAAALQVGYFGLLFNSQVIFMIFGVFLAFPGAGNKTAGLDQYNCRSAQGCAPSLLSFPFWRQ